NPDDVAVLADGVDDRVGDRVGRGGQWWRLHPGRHLGGRKTGAHDDDVDARAVQGVGETLREPVQPGVRRAVDEVRGPRALGGDRGHDDERAVTLGAQAFSDREQNRDGAAEVGLDDPYRPAAAALIALLVAQHSECEPNEVDIAVRVEDLRDEIVMRGEIERVEVDADDLRATVPKRSGASLEGAQIAAGQDDLAGAPAYQALAGRDRDVGVAAQDEDALDVAECVFQRSTFTFRTAQPQPAREVGHQPALGVVAVCDLAPAPQFRVHRG